MSPEAWKILEYAAWGGAGALLGSVAHTRTLQLPRIVRRGVDPGDQVVLLDLGFLVAPILGAVLAAIVDGRPQTAVAYGIAAGYAGPAFANALLDALLRRIGMPEVPAIIPREIPDGEGKP